MSSTDPDIPTPPRPASRQLMRWRQERGVAGVARGIAHLYGLEPWGVRLAFVAATLLGGVGAVLYVALTIAVPEVDRQPAETAGHRDVGEFVAMMAGLFAVGIFAIVEFSSLKWLLPAMLAVTGAVLWQRPRRADTVIERASVDDGGDGGRGTMWVPPTGVRVAEGMGPGAQSQPSAPTARWAPPGDGDGTPWTRPSAQPTAWVPPPPRPRPSFLGPIAALVAFVAMGALLVAALLGVPAVTSSMVLATGVAVVGAALLIGTVWGRAKWLAVPGLVLLAALGLSELAASNDVELLAAARNDVSGVRTAERLTTMDSAGSVDLALDDRALAGDPVDAELGVGLLSVALPWDAQVDLQGHVGLGVVLVGTEQDGHGRWVVMEQGLGAPGSAPVRSPWLAELPDHDPTTVNLDLRVGLGAVELQFDDPPPEVVEEHGLDLAPADLDSDVVVDFGPGELNIQVNRTHGDPRVDFRWDEPRQRDRRRVPPATPPTTPMRPTPATPTTPTPMPSASPTPGGN